MQRHRTLFERPVILSENRRNVIPHGRPLSPIGSVRSASPLFVPRQGKSVFPQEKHGDTPSPRSPSPVPSTTFTHYHKSAQDNLITINNNLSLMLKESFAGIDSICQKVRLCLLEANTIKKPENYESLPTLNRSETRHTLSTCHEEADSKATNDGVTDMEEDVDENVAEIVEEINAENEDNRRELKENIPAEKPKKTPSITPFFTILNPKTQSAESVGVKLIQSISSKLRVSRSRTAEGFQETMKEVAKLSDYEQILTSMVDDINKEIDQVYSEYSKKSTKGQKVENNDRSSSQRCENKRKDSRPSTSKSNHRKNNEISPHGQEELRKFREIMKIHKDMMEDQFSENDLTSKDVLSRRRRDAISVFSGRMDFTYPDVYRKRAITDLHRRLEAQVEANDSLIFFQKLMDKNRKFMEKPRPETASVNTVRKKSLPSNVLKTPMLYLLPPTRQNEKKQRSLGDLSKKYQDSLWFRQKKHEIKRIKKESSSQKGRREKKAAGKREEKVVPRSYTVQSTLNLGAKSNRNRGAGKQQFERKENPILSDFPETVCKCKIKVTNNEPMSEAQRCKLHWMRAKYSQLSQKKLKYLDILDDITKNDLLPIKAEYPRRDQMKSTNVKDSYLYKLLNEKDNNSQSAWEQLFQPSLKCALENCQKCGGTGGAFDKSGPDQEKNNHPTSTSNFGKGDVIRKLSKYIFLDQQIPTNPELVYTVMPVHVFYENSRVVANNRRPLEAPQRLPLVPMKETKDFVRKAEWTDVQRKIRPMRVVYDPILRKIEKEIRMVSAKQPDRSGSSKIGQTNSWSPKNFAQYCSPYRQSSPIGRKPSVKIDTLDKTPTKIKKSATMSNDRMQIAEIFKRSPKASSEKVTYPRRSTDLKIHTEDVEEKIQKTIHLEVHARRMSEEQRKIWENKYGKSTGQKLLSFIEKQPVPYQAPLPKYALPKIVKDPSRQQMMLEQLRRLRAKNDNIQANIQKAIEVIENKMVDILSKPTTTESIEAFDEMEKEITNVLTLMKTPNSVKNREQLAKVEEGGENEVNKISEELFKRLDRILESPGVSSSGKSSKNSLHRQMKAKKKREAKVSNSPPPKSTDMSQVCFSSTSASGEEKFTITAISPKRPHKAPTVPSFLKNYLDSTENSTIPDQVSTITSELRKLENELKVESEHTDEQKLGPIKAQVVNLLLFEQTQQEPSPGGDQLNVLNELLENDLKPVDPSDEQSNSVGDLFSQGDFNIDCAAEKTGDDNNNKENIFEMVDTTEDGISEKDQIQIESYTSRSSLKPVVSTQTTETANKTVSTEQPQEINVGQRDQTVLNLNQSQQSTEATGPYFTPLTSPLNKTRLEQDVQKSSMVEKDDDQQIPGSPTPKEVKDVAIEDVQTIRNSTDKPEELVCSQSEDGVPNETGSVENKHSTSLNEDDTSETSDGRDDFYENVNKIISRVENVYNQLEQFEEEMLLEERKLNTSIPAAKIAVFSEDTPTVPQVEADAFLTPFMHAVKDLRKSVGDKPGSQNSSPRLQKSPSFYNVLSFLDNLADFKQEVAVELYSSRLCHYSYLMHIPQTFGHSFVLHQAEKTTSLPMVTTSVALKKSGCLKNPSSHSHVNTVASKSKQKVSFLLKKEEKSTQVTACPFHSVVRILSRQKMSSSETFASCQKDEQVSAYLDARENNSVDKMSQPEEEDVSFQSTLEVTDDISSDKTTERMQETVEHNLQENLEKNEEGVASNKNVVEIFRHINTAENRTIDDIEVKSELIESQNFPEVQEKEGIESLEGNLITDFANRPETVKVFYDNFKTEQSAIDSKILSGFYNETSILQVEKSLSRDVQLKKRESLEKLTKSLNSELLLAEILKDTSLFEPLKNLNSFIDSKLLKEVVERRQKIRMMRRKSAQSLVPSGESLKIDRVEESQISGDGQKENLLKGLYVFVYLLMFTALNLEYKCVQ